MQFPPAIIITADLKGTFTYSGYCIEVIDYIARALNIRSDADFVHSFLK